MLTFSPRVIAAEHCPAWLRLSRAPMGRARSPSSRKAPGRALDQGETPHATEHVHRIPHVRQRPTGVCVGDEWSCDCYYAAPTWCITLHIYEKKGARGLRRENCSSSGLATAAWPVARMHAPVSDQICCRVLQGWCGGAGRGDARCPPLSRAGMCNPIFIPHFHLFPSGPSSLLHSRPSRPVQGDDLFVTFKESGGLSSMGRVLSCLVFTGAAGVCRPQRRVHDVPVNHEGVQGGEVRNPLTTIAPASSIFSPSGEK